MTDRPTGTRIGLHPALVVGLCAAGATLGVALGLGADALVSLLDRTVGSAPGLLRGIASVRDGVMAAVLGIVGALAGLLFAGTWEDETLVCEISREGVRTRLHKRRGWVPREAVADVFVDGEELVLADATGRMLAVGQVAGVGMGRLERAFTGAGYPWSGRGHPREGAFRTFVEGRDHPPHPITELLVARAGALAEKDHARARELRRQLSDAGALVRDRHGEQEYTLLEKVREPDA